MAIVENVDVLAPYLNRCFVPFQLLFEKIRIEWIVEIRYPITVFERYLRVMVPLVWGEVRTLGEALICVFCYFHFYDFY